MKKITLLAMSILFVCSSFAQTAPTTVEQPLHRAFGYVGTNYAPGNLLSYSAEVGTWGCKSNTSYSFVFDAVPQYGATTPQYWVGVKAYYTVHSEEKLQYMVYIAPKFSIDKVPGQVIEWGFNPNYVLNNDLLLAVTIGSQSSVTTPLNWFTSIGFIYLLPKK